MTALDDAIDRPSITWVEPQLLVPPRVWDDFSTDVVESWGTAPTGGQWANFPGDTLTDYNVTGGKATHNVSAVGTFRLSSAISKGVRERFLVNPDMVVVFSCAAAGPVGLLPAGLVFRRKTGNGSTTYMLFRLEVTSGGAFQASLRQYLSNVETDVSGTMSLAGATYAANTSFALRLAVVGGTARARIWQVTPGYEQTPETDPAQPSSWAWSWSGSMIRESGLFGVRSGLAGTFAGTPPVVFSYDYFAARDWPFSDMSDFLANGWSVKQAMDDGLPQSVTATSSGDAAGSLACVLLGDDRYGMTPTQTWSTLNPSSPIYGMDVDVAPVTLDHGALTDAGPSRARIFTGQMTNLKVTGGRAQLEALSETRTSLMKSVQPPAVTGAGEGATGTWLVDWVLWRCGIYISPPPPVYGCRWYAPMNGGLKPFMPGTNSTELITFQRPVTDDYPTWIEGPFPHTTAPDVGNTRWIEANPLTVDSGDDMMTTGGNRGRMELWIKAIDTVHGSAAFRWQLDDNDSVAMAQLDINGSTGTTTLTINDGGGNVSYNVVGLIPFDDEWHFLGAYWHMTGNYVELYFDGTTYATSPGMNQFDLPSSETLSMSLTSYYPVAQMMLLAGETADPEIYPWGDVRAAGWEPQAIVRPSLLTLEAIAEPRPREAWGILTDLARGELAAVRVDEDDVFCYLPLTYFGEAEQQTPAGAINTSVNAQDLDLASDPSRIRNLVTVQFSETRVDATTYSTVLSIQAAKAFRPGVTIATYPLDVTTTRVFQGGTFANLNSGDVAAGSWSTNFNHVTANTASNGSGTYLTSAQFIAEVQAWDAGSVTMRFTNLSGATAYLVNGGSGVPFLHVAGRVVVVSDGYVTASDTESIGIRGERSLTTQLGSIQVRSDACMIASLLVAMTAQPQPIATVPVLGNPNRRPGQLVTVVDTEQTQASGAWRVISIDHSMTGARYDQRMLIRRQLAAGLWDSSTWDGAAWAP